MFAFRRALHGFHLFHHPRTLRFGWKRRPPPARERLAKHSGDGNGHIVGASFAGGDEDGGKWLDLLGRAAVLSPLQEIFGR